MSIASQTQVEAITGRSSSHADWPLIAILWALAEQLLKDYVKGPIEQTTLTEYYPELAAYEPAGEPLEDPAVEVVGGRVLTDYGGTADVLRLRNTPVRSITSIHDNAAAWDSGTADFPASTLLTAGSDYLIDFDESGLCRSGLVYRRSGSWPVSPQHARTVKVIYVAGYTAGELSGAYSRFQTAALTAVLFWYNQVKANQQNGITGGAGAIVSESLDAYSVSFNAQVAAQNLGLNYELPFVARRMLHEDLNLNRYLP